MFRISVGFNLTTKSAQINAPQVRFASKKSGGSTRNGRKSAGKRLGIKKCNGEGALIGHILMRQRGFKFHPGVGVVAGRDHTLVAVREGIVRVHYELEGGRRFISIDDGSLLPELYPTMQSIKKRLTDRIDSAEYLKLDQKQRFNLVAQKTEEIKAELKLAEEKHKLERAGSNVRRVKFVDLAL